MAKLIQHSVTIGTGSTFILPRMPHKPDYIRIVNDSDEAIYLKVGAAAVLNEGIRLSANGGEFVMKRGENMLGDYITGISTSGSKKVVVHAIGSDFASYFVSVNDSATVSENLGKLASLLPNIYEEISVAEDITISNPLLYVSVNEAVGLAEVISGQGGDENVSVNSALTITENMTYAIVPS